MTLSYTNVHTPLPRSVSVTQTLSVRGRRIPHRALGRRRAYAYHDLRVAAALHDPAQFHPRGRVEVDRPFTAVFVGRGEPAKGLHLALQTWIDSPAAHDGRFLVLGRLLPDYQRHLSDLLSHRSVQTLGFVDNVADVLRESDVLVFPTFTEGSALVTYEAMACGVVPLVSTSAGAPIRDGIDGFLHATEDVSTLGRQLARLSTDPSLLAAMRRAAIAASADLTWESAGARLLAAYREGIDRARSRSEAVGAP